MAKRRRVRLDRYKEQIAENVIGPDGLLELELSESDSVKVKLPILLDEGDDYTKRLAEAADEEERALIVFGFNPERSAEEQLAAYLAAGGTYRDLAVILQAETATAQEALGKLRYRG